MLKSSEVAQCPEKDINIAASKSDILSVQCLLKNGADPNNKDMEGRTPLHFAAISGNIDIVKTLLEYGADMTHVTAYGDTPLHFACSKGQKENVDVLLQHIGGDKLNSFLNAKSVDNGTTALHLAAMRGSLEMVKSLLKHGAAYDTGNIEDVAPVALAKDQGVTTLLRLIQELFDDSKNGNVEIIAKLKALNTDDLVAILNTRDRQGHTLLQVAISMKHMDIADQLLQMLKKPEETQNLSDPTCKLKQLQQLIRATEIHIEFSELYLPMLRQMSQPYESEKNYNPWKTLKEGSYYLGNAFRVVNLYKKFVPEPIDNIDIKLVNDTLTALEFDLNHLSEGYTDEAYGGEALCFVSKGQGTKYYNLLHSDWKKDVRSFIQMVELNIDKPLMKFLESLNQTARSVK